LIVTNYFKAFMNMHFATLWEHISDTIPGQTAIIHGNRYVTWSEFDDRAAKLATLLRESGLGSGSKIGLYLHNGNEYLEAQYAIFKIGACPVNVNYRYMDSELVYLLDNADADAIFFETCYADRVQQIIHHLPGIKLLIQVDDGTGELMREAVGFEDSIEANEPLQRLEQDPKDLYMIYTGGTTGMPKGVMYENGDMCSLMLMGYAFRGIQPPDNYSQVAGAISQVSENDLHPVSLVACPLMHGTGMWLGAMMALNLGGSVVTVPNLKFDADELLQTVEATRATEIVIVGDAFAKPIAESLETAIRKGNPYDISSVSRIISSGVMWTADTKKRLLEHGDMVLLDAMGSSEGSMGLSITTREAINETAKFVINADARVFNDQDLEVSPGSGEIGMIGTAGIVPHGYYKDPDKSSTTFREIDGVRYSFPGDYARVEADGSLTLLGRGSMSINTAGEKVFPEEVEEIIKEHSSVYDCLVVGVPDDKYVERVVALASLQEGSLATADELISHCKSSLAGYKVPKQILLVPQVQRASNGKADYKWAHAKAVEMLAT
jgi:fatty-acyl-CoA synthase